MAIWFNTLHVRFGQGISYMLVNILWNSIIFLNLWKFGHSICSIVLAYRFMMLSPSLVEFPPFLSCIGGCGILSSSRFARLYWGSFLKNRDVLPAGSCGTGFRPFLLRTHVQIASGVIILIYYSITSGNLSVVVCIWSGFYVLRCLEQRVR